MPQDTPTLNTPTFDQTLKDWARLQRGARMAKVTISERLRIVVAFADEMNVNPLTASSDDISEWIASHDEWSASTACAYWDALNAYYRWAMLHGRRDDHPLTMLTPPRRPERVPRPLTGKQVKKLLETPKRARAHRMILLATCAGLRIHEIAKVHHRDVDPDGQQIEVLGKRGKRSTLPLHPLLREQWEDAGSGFWFKSPHGDRPIQAKSAGQVITRAMQDAGVRGTPHQLRHFYASRLLAQGVDIRTIQDLMRHSSIQTTMQYTKLPDRMRRAAINGFDPMTVLDD